MDLIAIVVLILSTCAALLVAPDIHAAAIGEPVIVATLTTPLVLAALVGLRFTAMPSALERWLLASFLLLMPAIYLASLALHGGGARWAAVEILGQVIFAALAIAGLVRSGWYLALGIAAHGLFWDLWHHGRTPFIPDWYTVGCLVVDVGFGLYAASRVALWHAEAAARRAGGSSTASAPSRPRPGGWTVSQDDAPVRGA